MVGPRLLTHPTSILIPFVVAVAGGFVTTATGSIPSSAHVFTSVLYEFTSESANNGSALSDGYFNDATPFFNLAGAVVMLVGRFIPFFAMLMVGGLFSEQETQPASAGTLRTASLTFTLYITLFLIIMSVLLFLPVIALGPLAQII